MPLYLYFSIDGDLGCLQVFSLRNDAAMNILEQVP